MTDPAALSFYQMVKTRDDFTLGPINLELKSGFAYGLVGPNGSGKTTFLKSCVRLVQPSAGEIRIGGMPFDDKDERAKKQVAYVPAKLEGCELFTLREMGKLIGVWYKEWRDEDFLRRGQLFRVPFDKPYGRLSEGEQKKAALALALSTNAPILLLDEPTNGLDMESRHRLRKMLIEDMEHHCPKTIVMASHSAEDIRQFADYILVMKEGQLRGPFEKDSLLESWARLWLEGDQLSARLPDKMKVPGVIAWGEETHPNLVTQDRQQTIAYLQDHGIEIIKEQSLPFEELLELLTLV